MADPDESEECETCGGDGELEEDCFSHATGHYTRSIPCPDCEGTGRRSDSGPDYDPVERELDRPPPTEDRTGLKDPPL